jgi:predicted transcriptional regulator
MASAFESGYRSQDGFRGAFKDERRNDVAILKSPPRPPKNETLQIRVEEQIKAKLHKYAEFINSSESYVVSEALKLLFRKDAEFKIWLEEQPRNSLQPQNGGSADFETASKT